MKTKYVTFELTRAETEAALIAVSNYTPKKGGWKQAAQGRAANKMRFATLLDLSKRS